MHLTVNRRTWTDADKKRIEDRLASFGDVLADVIREIKQALARAEKRQRCWAEEDARIQAEERKRVEELERQAAAWQVSCSIRQFIEAVRAEATRRTERIEPGSSLDHWIQWAERHANTLDPVGSVLAGAVSADQQGVG
jgi:hypothetical protein